MQMSIPHFSKKVSSQGKKLIGLVSLFVVLGLSLAGLVIKTPLQAHASWIPLGLIPVACSDAGAPAGAHPYAFAVKYTPIWGGSAVKQCFVGGGYLSVRYSRAIFVDTWAASNTSWVEVHYPWGDSWWSILPNHIVFPADPVLITQICVSCGAHNPTNTWY